MKKFKISILIILICLLSACNLEVENESKTQKESVNKIEETKEEMEEVKVEREENTVSKHSNDNIYTLYTENLITGNYYKYFFSGFINETTLAFQKVKSHELRPITPIYFPATIGYQFQFEGIENVIFEIVDVNRDGGYIKVKIKSAS